MIPYASFYGTALCLAGLVGFLAVDRRFLLACAFAGLCFGVAATFKQTMGAFAFLALALYLLMEGEVSIEHERSRKRRLWKLPEWIVRSGRWFVLARCQINGSG